jgi:TolB-like protein
MQQNQQTQPQQPKSQPATRPNERGTIAVLGFLKISDPETKQVFVETSA